LFRLNRSSLKTTFFYFIAIFGIFAIITSLCTFVTKNLQSNTLW